LVAAALDAMQYLFFCRLGQLTPGDDLLTAPTTTFSPTTFSPTIICYHLLSSTIMGFELAVQGIMFGKIIF